MAKNQHKQHCRYKRQVGLILLPHQLPIAPGEMGWGGWRQMRYRRWEAMVVWRQVK